MLLFRILQSLGCDPVLGCKLMFSGPPHNVDNDVNNNFNNYKDYDNDNNDRYR